MSIFAGKAATVSIRANDGEWFDLSAALKKIELDGLSGQERLAQRGQMRTGEIARRAGLTAPEVRWLLRRLQVGGLPIAEADGDVWKCDSAIVR